MKRRLIKITAIMTLVISVFCGCSTSKNDIPANVEESLDVRKIALESIILLTKNYGNMI